MARRSYTPVVDPASKEFYAAAVTRYGSVRAAAKALGVPKSTLHDIGKGTSRVPALRTQARLLLAHGALPAREKRALDAVARVLPLLPSNVQKALKTRLRTASASKVKEVMRNVIRTKTTVTPPFRIIVGPSGGDGGGGGGGAPGGGRGAASRLVEYDDEDIEFEVPDFLGYGDET